MNLLTSDQISRVAGGRKIYTFRHKHKGFRRQNIRITREIGDSALIPRGWHRARHA